jgi:hypothetical protein
MTKKLWTDEQRAEALQQSINKGWSLDDPKKYWQLIAEDEVWRDSDYTVSNFIKTNFDNLFEISRDEYDRLSHWDRSEVNKSVRKEAVDIIYSHAKLVRSARSTFKRSSHFLRGEDGFSIKSDSDMRLHPLVKNQDVRFVKDPEHNEYEAYRDGNRLGWRSYSSLFDICHFFSIDIQSEYDKLEEVMDLACHRGKDDLLEVAKEKIPMVSPSDIISFLSTYNQPEPLFYNVVMRSRTENGYKDVVIISDIDPEINNTDIYKVFHIIAGGMLFDTAFALKRMYSEYRSAQSKKKSSSQKVEYAVQELKDSKRLLSESSVEVYNLQQELEEKFHLKIQNEPTREKQEA